MFDLPAMPIAFALTLWDSIPIFLSVSLALAIASRAILTGSRFESIWRVRESAGIEGLVYLAIFMPLLLPVLAVAGIIITLVAWRAPAAGEPLPASPRSALRTRAEEAIVPVLMSSALAAYIKVAGPDIAGYGQALEVLVALVAGGLTGNRSGTAAIPAVAVMVHLGGAAPATVCIFAATVQSAVLLRRSTSAVAGA